MIHKLKIENNYLQNLLAMKKKAEIRYNDRDYQLGDIIVFTYYESHREPLEHKFKITHVHSGLGMKDGYVVLSLNYMDAVKNAENRS